MLTADPLDVCEIMLNIHCKKIRSFGGRLEVAHRLQTFSHGIKVKRKGTPLWVHTACKH